MKATTLALAAVGIIALFAAKANAGGAISYPMSAHEAAKYGIQDPRLPAQVRAIERHKAIVKQVGYRHGGHGHHGKHHGHHRGHGYHHGHRAVIHPPIIVAPYGGYYPYGVYRAPCYHPHYNFHYRGRGVSFGFGF